MFNRYMRLAKMLIKNQNLLTLFKKLHSDDYSWKRFWISHSGRLMVYGFGDAWVLLRVRGLQFYVGNRMKTMNFHSGSFNTAKRAVGVLRYNPSNRVAEKPPWLTQIYEY